MNFDVIIAGAGAAGLAAAAALAASAEDGLRVALIDRMPFDDLIGEREDARAWAISASSCRMLEAIGAWQHLAEHAQPVTSIEITDTPLEAAVRLPILQFDNALAEQDVDDASSSGRVPASWIIENSRLIAALQKVVAACAPITRLIPADIQTFRANGETAELRLGDGRELTARLVIAVDGRKSKLRRQAGIKTVGWDYRQSGIVTAVSHDRPHHGAAIQHFLPSGPFAILPLKGNRSSLVWTETTANAARMMTLDDAAFLAEVERRFGGRLGEIRLEGPRASWPLDMHLARSFISQRLALAGDAAHGVHPIAGQGLNIGLRDIAALTQVIIETNRLGLDFGNSEALGRYARWRRFDATMSAFAFDGINRIFSNDNPLLRTIRDFGANSIDRMPALKRLLIEEASGVRGELPKLLRGEAV